MRSAPPWDTNDLLRNELFSIDRLEDHAAALAARQPVAVRPRARQALRARLRENAGVLLANYRAIAAAVRDGHGVTPAAEWLLDNYHIIETQVQEVNEDLPAGYYRQLPKLARGALAGYPRVFGIAWEFVAHTDSHFDPEALRRFLLAYQRVQPLTIGELWAVTITLRIVLVENLRRCAERIALARREREDADRVADRLLGLHGPAEPDALRDVYTANRILSAAFVVQLVQRLRDQDPEVTPALRYLEQRLAAQGTASDTIVQQEHQRQGGSNITVRNIITSMRLISDTDWSEFFESVSVVDEVLRGDAAFAAMDFATRNLYRSAIEQLGRGTVRSEIEIARAAVAATRSATGRAADPGYHLIAGGRPAFERSIGFRAPWAQRPHRLLRRAGAGPYIAAITVVALALCGVALHAIATDVGGAGVLLLFGFLGLIPAFDAAVAFVNRAVAQGVGAMILPGLALRDGVPPEFRTLIAIPTLLTTVEAVRVQIEQLEVHFLASPQSELYFALLADWSDAASERAAADAELLATALRGIARLNERHPPGRGGPRFLFLHRRRVWSVGQGCWMGWERKRGKLHELNRLLRGATDTSFHDPLEPAPQVPAGVRFVITLDADTRLPRETARRLIGKLAHPLNRPRFDAARGRVVEGYGVLQPRVTPSLPGGTEGSLYQRVVSSASGLDPYAAAVSDVYQDLFGEGSYTGKGIYDVDAFEAALRGRAPDGTLLSHDLFEGIFARAGLASDVEVVEEFPARYDVASSRQHRWARGDWQLLPWLFGRQHAHGGPLLHGGLPLIGRWKIVDNLRRTLSAPASFLALLLGWTLSPHAAIVWTLFIIGTNAVPTLLPVLGEILPRRPGISARSHLRALGADSWLALRRIAFQLVLLPHQAALMTDAVLRTLYRLFVSHRNLLEWVTAARAMQAERLDVAAAYARMGGGVALTFGAAALLAVLGCSVWWLAAPVIVIWLGCPMVAVWISRCPPLPGRLSLSNEDAERLRDVARRTWGYFDTFVTDESHQLPPDNFQEDPLPVVAQRTSPTNIGLYLLAVVSARDFEWIGTQEAVARLEATLATMSAMQRHRGHFFNWYGTRDLVPLAPLYVSSVDSGNLAAHLVTLANALREWALGPPLARDVAADAAALADRLRAMAVKALAFAWEMDFAFLLDPARRLLSIGYRCAEGTLDPSCYDLLASEARLASFFAIAKDDVPSRHWFRLGRPVTAVGFGAALISWSGSMFEYLMPSLVMRAPRGSLLDETNVLIVRRQMQHAESHGVPWGISESAYNARDLELTYQYSNFGVPGLGLKRGLSANLVIAPYATALAAMVRPADAAANLARLASIGALGSHGFYEAVDFTPDRVPKGQRFVVVKAYMAHHQGMTIVAIANVLLDGIMRRRFHAEPAVQATELLLQERTPRDVSVAHPRAEEVHTAPPVEGAWRPVGRRLTTLNDATPQVNLLSNGRYAVMLTAAGSGYSRWRDLAVSRWREDGTRDDAGSYIFLRDVETARVWSAGHQPTRTEADDYTVTFTEDRAEYLRQDGTITTALSVVVSPEDDAEARHVAVTNTGVRHRVIEVTSYLELVLAPAAADTAHPAFSKLFVQTEYLADLAALLATRRRRGPEEAEIWVAHQAIVEGGATAAPQHETDRARFIGRGEELCGSPAALSGLPLSDTVGTVLDPVFALRQRIEVPAGATVRLTFWTSAAASRAEVLKLADKHRDANAFIRAGMLAWTQAQVQLLYLGITAVEAGLFQRLAGHLVFADPSLRPSSDVIRRGGAEPAVLWSQGISGDLPILLLRIDDLDHIEVVRQLLLAHEYWRMKNLAIDLVILNERESSYVQELQTTLETVVRMSTSRGRISADATRGAVHVLRTDLITAQVRAALGAAARVVLAARRGDLSEQLDRARIAMAPARRHGLRALPNPGHRLLGPGADELEFFNGLGGFADDGREYVTLLGPGKKTPAPWINVIANPEFGFQVAAEGGGYTWSQNSREHALTPWSNDPVSDRCGEAFYIQDDDSGDLWGPTAAPTADAGAFFTVRHGQGYSRFLHESRGIALDLLMFVPLADPVKISRLRLHNLSRRTRHLSIAVYVEWVLGVRREASAPSVVTESDPVTGALFARNPGSAVYGSRVAFADLGGRQTDWTADRREFLGRHGSLDQPAALQRGPPWSRRVGAGLDPCAALLTQIELPAGATLDVDFFLGECADAAGARALIQRYRGADLAAAFDAVTAHWEELLGTVQVRTPDRSMDIMLNRWMLYQTLACRLWARSAFYQASGAYGFRDQLQDTMALCIARPALAREHLLRAAGRQFIEGDVQHWWLPATGQGVRTRISDDRVWLAYVAAHYVTATGDAQVLEEPVAYLDGQVLRPEEQEAFFQPSTADQSATLFEHCAQGLDRSLAMGVHGLPLMGAGDWNDGMNRVGQAGKGESVWLGWFLHAALQAFLPLAEQRGDRLRVLRWRECAQGLAKSLDEQGWDGAWYRRGFYDDGSTLGSAADVECRIDSIAQSWSVLSEAGIAPRPARAMDAVLGELVRPAERLALLFAPPFDHSPADPGYVKGYPPGIRENGGQYTHAAAWCVIALTRLGEADAAAAVFAMLNPINHSAQPDERERYKVEPYVVAADIYSVAPHVGRGGWTWYTGSAAWLYRAGLEAILGFRVQGDRLLMAPVIPAHWPGFEIRFRHRTAVYEIRVQQSHTAAPVARTQAAVRSIDVDGERLAAGDSQIALVDDGRVHEVRVQIERDRAGDAAA